MELDTTLDTGLAGQIEDRPEPAIPTTPVGTAAPSRVDTAPADTLLIEDELLVEEISIDGMCGVY